MICSLAEKKWPFPKFYYRRQSAHCYDVTDFENGELHSRTANSTDRNTDLSIFQHSKYVGYASRNSAGHERNKKKRCTTPIYSLLSSKLYLSPSASVPLLKVFKNETFCHCLLWLFQFETMALFLFLLQKLIFMSKDLLHRFG